MGIQVLGPLIVGGFDGLGLRDRVVLETLVVRGEQDVSKEVLADALYGESPPATWNKVVQGCIARLRKSLGAEAIRTTPYGYRLVIHDDELDARTFERLLARAREHLTDGDPDRASYVLTEALQLWRGPALSDLVEWEPGRVEAERLDGLRMDAQELRIEAEIAAGRARNCLDEARTLVKEAQFRERRWSLFARALYQSGRQTEALDVLQRARRLLREEFGLDPGAELLAIEEAILRQDAALDTQAPTVANLVCPYRGLLPYEAQDTESFFGRDDDIAACLKRLRDTGVLAVVGPSGTGKSSVVRAGVVAALERENIPVLVTTPGGRPLDSLAPLPTQGPLPVLVVDQAEEAVTLCGDAIERTAYFERLGAYGGQLVIALRADRLGDLSGYPEFARLLDRGFYLLAAMSEADLRKAIEGPAQHAGLRLEPGLVDLLVREVEGEPGALPMLSHVLRQTWEHREGSTLTVEGYRLTGGIRNAVAQSAERLYEGLEEWQRSQLRSLLLRLVMPGEDGESTRARVSRDRLAVDPAHDNLVEALVNARLLSSDDHEVQIAHEALVREWPRLRDWLDEDVEGQRTFRHLAGAAEAWDAEGQPDSELYRGVRLARAVEWAEVHSAQLTATETAFLNESRAHADVERRAAEKQLRVQRRSNSRLRIALAGIAVLLVAAVTAGVLAVNAADQSERDAAVADANAVIADSRRLAAQALTLTEPDVALLLGVEAVRLDDSLASRSTLYDVLGKSSQLFAVARPRGVLEDLEVSSDGKTIAVTTSMGGELATYDSETLTQTAARDDLGGFQLKYSPDGRTLAVSVVEVDQSQHVVFDPKPLQILDSASLEPIGEFGGGGPRSFFEKMDFSSNGERFAAVQWRESGQAYRPVAALVWDVAQPEAPIRRVPMPGLHGSVELSPDGRVLYVTQRAQPIRAIEVDTGREVASRPVDSGGERGVALALSDDGTIVANASVEGIEIRNADDLSLRTIVAGASEGVSTLTFNQDGSRLVAGYSDGNTIVWDHVTPKPLQTLRGHTQEVWDAAFSPDGGSLYTVSRDGQLIGWDLAGTRGFPPWRGYPTNPDVDNPFRAVASPDGQMIAYVGYGSPDGRPGAQLRFRDVDTGNLTDLQYLPFYGELNVSWSPDSQAFLSHGGYEPIPERGLTHTRVLQTWNPASGALEKERLDTDVVWATYTAGGKILAVSEGPLDEPGPVTISTLDPTTLQPEGATVQFEKGSVGHWPTLPHPDGRTVIMANENKPGGLVIDLAAGTTTPYSTELPAIWAAALSPDGGRLVVYGLDRRWGVVDVGSLSEKHIRWLVPQRPHQGVEPWEFFWSADGSQIFATGNGSVELWDAKTLTHLGSLSAGSKDNIATVTALPDGHSVMMAHPQGAILTWDLGQEHLMEVACTLAGRNLSETEWTDYIGERPYRETCSAESLAP